MIIATLIAADRLTQEHISAASGALAAIGLRCCPGDYSEACAQDLVIDQPEDAGISGRERMAAIRQALERGIVGVDVVVQPAEHRRKRLLVADMDSTMITVECIDELADYAGLKREVAQITERAMRGELDFAAALDARVALLAGMDAAMIDRCRAERVRPMPGAARLVRTMKAQGATCILVSGGFTRFADAVAAEIGFDRAVANVLEIAGGALTGGVTRPIVDAAAKRRVLLDAAAELGLAPEQVLAVGDGANDVPMLEAAGLGIAYHAKPAAAEAADAAIRHGDLRALLHAQGIAPSAWVES